MTRWSASSDDVDAVTRLLGRAPSGRFRVVVRRVDTSPVVIENAPHLDDGTPMPTLYWLIDPVLRSAVSTIESTGGVRRLEACVDPEEIAAAHERYAERRVALSDRPDRPQSEGGVGGTRRGVKCLHAHLAAHLAGMDDPVGALVAAEVDLPVLIRTDELQAGDDVAGSSS